MKAKKGEWGYLEAQRIRRLVITILLFSIPALIFMTSMLYFGTNKNIMTIVAMVGIVPASMSLVNLIMFLMRKSLPEEEYRAIHEHEGDLTVAYELYMTSEKQNAMVDCIAICGNEVVGLVTSIDGNKIFSLNAHADDLRSGIEFQERDGYSGYGREDLIRHFALNYSL